MDPTFSSEHVRQLEARGIPVVEARHQLELLSRTDHHVELVRPCTVGDGIERIDDDELPALGVLHTEAAAAGRFMKFVPASGAATRMFEALFHFLRGEGRDLDWQDVRRQAGEGTSCAVELVAFVEQVRQLPFADELDAELRRRGGALDDLARAGEFRSILAALLDADGLDFGRQAKALLPFHGYAAGVRTALEEHLVEAAHYARDGEGICRLHFTVSPEHRSAFEHKVAAVGAGYERRFGVRFRIGYSVQKSSTDTLALGQDGKPALDGAGGLRFRPGGHGALIENLSDLGADLVFVKNIDNVQQEHRMQATLDWKPALAGRLVELQVQVSHHLDRLRDATAGDGVVQAALEFAGGRLGAEVERFSGGEGTRQRLAARLDRPLRVCGVVPNTGEPGGGPFWVRRPDGAVVPQIVEDKQVAPDDSGQQAILRASTHFNPVDLVCAVRDSAGGPYDLTKFVDREAVIVSMKSEGGQDFRALELPGLWNGAMADWNTVFVEVPIETFSPAKTVEDLLRPVHQGDAPIKGTGTK